MADEILLLIRNQAKPVVDQYLQTVAQSSLQKYRQATQRGIREGQNLYTHLTGGSLLLYALGRLLTLDDQEIRLLMSAFSIHDLNKLYEPGGKGLRQLADDSGFLERTIHEAQVAAFFPQWEDYLVDLRQLILGHGGHTTLAGEQLLAHIPGSQLGKERLAALTHLMRAVDIADLSRSFEEQRFKDKFLLEVNSVGPRQFRMISHRLGEHRGVFSNLIHNRVMQALERHYGAAPVLHYAEGTWYLIEAKTALPDHAALLAHVQREVRQALDQVRSQDLGKIVVLTKDGVKVDPSLFALGLGPDAMVNAITTQVFRRRFTPSTIASNRTKCAERLGRKVTVELTDYLEAHHLHYPGSEEGMRAGELLRAVYNLINMHLQDEAAALTSGTTDPWEMVYQLLDVDGKALEPLDKLYDRPFVLAGTLGQTYPDLEQRVETLLADLLAGREARAATAEHTPEDFLTAYLADTLDTDFAPRPRPAFAAYFQAYTSQNHRQCCYSAFSGRAENWMSAEVPKGIMVQQFSNRLQGGAKREPKRNVCPVCREQFFLEQMLFRAGGAKGMYLHFFPDGSLSAEYLSAVRHTLVDALGREVEDADTFFLPTETSLIEAAEERGLPLLAQKARGFARPLRSEAIGNVISLSVCPGLDVSSDGARVLQCAEIGLRLARFLGLRCLVSESPIPPLIPEQFFYIDTLPVSLQGFLGGHAFDRPAAEALAQRYAALRLVDREVRVRYDSIAWELARALGSSPLAIFAVADRTIERKLRDRRAGHDGALGLTIRARVSRALRELAEGGQMMTEGKQLSTRVQNMADIATEYKLWGRSRINPSSLLSPLSTVFENLRRKSPEMDMPFVRAQTIQNIFAHLSRVRRQANPRFRIGDTKRRGITAYVDAFYQMFEDIYHNQPPRLLSQEKALKAAYLCFLSEAMQTRQLEPLDEEPEDGDTE